VWTSERAGMLDEDAELAEAVDPARRAAAKRASVGVVLVVPPGRWNAEPALQRTREGYGLLVLAGLITHRVGIAGRFGAEVLAAGDLVGTTDCEAGDPATLLFATDWRVILPARVALLDRGWANRMRAFPEIGPALGTRALARSRRFAAAMAIARQPRLDRRLWTLFWHLADRHGRVHADGVHLDLPLTHELLAHMAAARRPSVSTALGQLEREGRILRAGQGWILKGDPADGEPATDAAA
jgi:CRP/FNR family transcriptional regulator, cyclic AMP receptor protein